MAFVRLDQSRMAKDTQTGGGETKYQEQNANTRLVAIMYGKQAKQSERKDH